LGAWIEETLGAIVVDRAQTNSFAAIDNHGQILGNGPSRSQPGFLLDGSVYKTIRLPFAGATCAGMSSPLTSRQAPSTSRLEYPVPLPRL